jgi:hypothetical protein
MFSYRITSKTHSEKEKKFSNKVFLKILTKDMLFWFHAFQPKNQKKQAKKNNTAYKRTV